MGSGCPGAQGFHGARGAGYDVCWGGGARGIMGVRDLRSKNFKWKFVYPQGAKGP